MTDVGWRHLLSQIHNRIDEFDSRYSRFREDSWVSRMAKQAGDYDMPDDGFKLFEFYTQLYEATGGKVTPLIGRTMEQAGYDPTYSLKSGRLTVPDRLEDTLSFDRRRLRLKTPALLDFGAAGKGYLIDLVAEIITSGGIKRFMINAGGDILRRAPKHDVVSIGLENPFDASEAVGVLDLANGSLCASAGNKRQWAGMHHIIDPHRLESPRHIAATWVMASDTMTADGLATALFFVPPRQLLKRFDFAYAILTEDMGINCSHDFPVKLFEAA
jgi:thiamine biosynthesis lipoprotein